MTGALECDMSTHRKSARVGSEYPEVPSLGIPHVAGSLHGPQHRFIENVHV